MYPIFLNEALVRSFVFYQAGSLYRGFVLKYQIFKLVRYFDGLERDSAIRLALSLEHQQLEAIVTSSEERYGVWVTVTADIECDRINLFPQMASSPSLNPSLNASSAVSVTDETTHEAETQHGNNLDVFGSLASSQDQFPGRFPIVVI